MPIDNSQVRALSSRLQTVGGRIGAPTAMVLRRTAYAIEGDAKVFAPVDTGNLRNSISTEIAGDGRFGAMTAEIGPTAEYGIYQEFGTSRMPAHPFMGPAFDRHTPGYTAALANIAAKEV